MKTTYYVVRELNQQQQCYHPTKRQWVARDESDSFARRYTSRDAAKRRADLVGGRVAVGRQYLAA